MKQECFQKWCEAARLRSMAAFAKTELKKHHWFVGAEQKGREVIITVTSPSAAKKIGIYSRKIDGVSIKVVKVKRPNARR